MANKWHRQAAAKKVASGDVSGKHWVTINGNHVLSRER
jgi:hypothetical protein